MSYLDRRRSSPSRRSYREERDTNVANDIGLMKNKREILKNRKENEDIAELDKATEESELIEYVNNALNVEKGKMKSIVVESMNEEDLKEYSRVAINSMQNETQSVQENNFSERQTSDPTLDDEISLLAGELETIEKNLNLPVFNVIPSSDNYKELSKPQLGQPKTPADSTNATDISSGVPSPEQLKNNLASVMPHPTAGLVKAEASLIFSDSIEHDMETITDVAKDQPSVTNKQAHDLAIPKRNKSGRHGSAGFGIDKVTIMQHSISTDSPPHKGRGKIIEFTPQSRSQESLRLKKGKSLKKLKKSVVSLLEKDSKEQVVREEGKENIRYPPYSYPFGYRYVCKSIQALEGIVYTTEEIGTALLEANRKTGNELKRIQSSGTQIEVTTQKAVEKAMNGVRGHSALTLKMITQVSAMDTESNVSGAGIFIALLLLLLLPFSLFLGVCGVNDRWGVFRSIRSLFHDYFPNPITAVEGKRKYLHCLFGLILCLVLLCVGCFVILVPILHSIFPFLRDYLSQSEVIELTVVWALLWIYTLILTFTQLSHHHISSSMRFFVQKLSLCECPVIRRRVAKTPFCAADMLESLLSSIGPLTAPSRSDNTTPFGHLSISISKTIRRVIHMLKQILLLSILIAVPLLIRVSKDVLLLTPDMSIGVEGIVAVILVYAIPFGLGIGSYILIRVGVVVVSYAGYMTTVNRRLANLTFTATKTRTTSRGGFGFTFHCVENVVAYLNLRRYVRLWQRVIMDTIIPRIHYFLLVMLSLFVVSAVYGFSSGFKNVIAGTSARSIDYIESMMATVFPLIICVILSLIISVTLYNISSACGHWNRQGEILHQYLLDIKLQIASIGKEKEREETLGIFVSEKREEEKDKEGREEDNGPNYRRKLTVISEFCHIMMEEIQSESSEWPKTPPRLFGFNVISPALVSFVAILGMSCIAVAIVGGVS